MSDVRALLKAKRQEVRVNHPLAAYTSTGQLRCIACNTAVKQASSWEGHVGSKAHRVNAARLREEEQRREVLAQREQQAEEVAHAKRKASEDEAEDGEAGLHAAESKRRRLDESQSPQDQRPTAKAGAFPADFFSDPSQAPPAAEDEDEDEDDGAAAAPAPAASAAQPSVVDLEWEKFQQEVLNPPDADDKFQQATIVAEPVLHFDVTEGFPPRAEDAPEAEPEELTEEQLRQKKEQEERELIMDRLMEEERAQEEADARVTMLKTRLEALRKQREAKKASKAKAGA